MKKVKRWRYYCDYCKKSGGSGGHMKNHEEICTANPNRKCGFCRIMDEVQPDIEDLKNIILKNVEKVTNENFREDEQGEWWEFSGISMENEFSFWNKQKKQKEIEVLKELREASNDCPACILSAMRQTQTTFLFPLFDFKKEKESMYKAFMDSQQNYY